MIARFRPNYSYRDLFLSFKNNFQSTQKLIDYLSNIYQTNYVFLFDQARVALYVLLKSLGENGGVISPAYNCIVVPDAIRFAQMSNQFADVSLDDYNMTGSSVQKIINSKSKVLLATHQFGVPCDMEAFEFLAKKYNLLLFEDAAASMGAKIGNKLTGTFGKAAIISFQDTKVVTAVKGGALVVFDKNIAERVQRIVVSPNNSALSYLRKGLLFKAATLPIVYSFAFPFWTGLSGGFTMAESTEKDKPKDYLVTMDNFSSALVLRQISKLSDNVAKRETIGQQYISGLNKCPKVILPKIMKGITPSWCRFPIRVSNKLDFFKKLNSNGIDLAWTFSYSCASEYGDKLTAPNSIEASMSILDLPIYPSLTTLEINKIISSIKVN